MGDECVSCGRAVTDAYLCVICTNNLEREIGELAALDADLLVTYSRQSRIGRNVGARNTETPVPWNDKAARERNALKAMLTATVRDLAGDQRTMARDTVPGLAEWLLGHLQAIRLHPAADEICSEIHEAIARGTKICSGPPTTIFAGPCQMPIEGSDDHEPCGAELYIEAQWDEKTETATPIATDIECPRCHEITDIAQQRDYLLAEINDMLVGAATAARVLSALGIDVASATIRKWKERGQLTAKGLDRDGHETYLICDIRELHEQAVERAAKRRKSA